MTKIHKSKQWEPQAKSVAILNRGLEFVESVSYKVSLRWLFYRLLQQGFYRGKSDYETKMKGLFSDARKNFWNGWRPDTLADETRQEISQKGIFRDESDFFSAMEENLHCSLDEWYQQLNYVEVFFEAKAMTDQFRHLIPEHITLVPFGGDASIPYKWKIAKRFEEAYKKYQPESLIALYFGDLDEKGKKIPQSAFIDIQKWCKYPISLKICGLNETQVEEFGLLENPDKQGEYQWEALSDVQAREIILSAVEKYIDHEAFDENKNEEDRITEKIQEIIKNARFS